MQSPLRYPSLVFAASKLVIIRKADFDRLVASHFQAPDAGGALEALKLELAPGYHKAWRAMKQDRDSLFSFWISKADTLVPAAGTD